MSRWIGRLAPSATDVLRIDHAHLASLYRHFRAGTTPRRKQALVEQACIALELHAQLEEELFYPALEGLAADILVAEKSRPEHEEMRRLVARLRALTPDDAAYDAAFVELMRDSLHHIADEETTLLPAAERLLPDRLGEIGARMLRRRAAELLPRTGTLGTAALRSLPESAVALADAGNALLGSLFRGRARR